MKSKIVFAVAAITLLISSCGKDKTPASNSSGRVVVVNEGGFNHGDASISLYDPSSKTVSNDIFKNQNSFSMGDVAQSVYMIGDTAYITMNNSASVVVADAAHNFKYLRSINIAGSSPRYFIPVNSTKGYVTDLYANKIWIVNYRTGTVTGSISVAGWTEQMIAQAGKVYVQERTSPSGAAVHKLLAIDPATDKVTSSLDLDTDPGSMILTDQGKLYVLTSAQTSPARPASLYIIDPSSLTILRKKDFSPTSSPGYLRYSTFAHQIMYADSGVYTMAQTDTILPQTPAIASHGWNLYGLDADPDNGDIYISDALDYQQASHIMRYNTRGTLIDAFNAGIITNGFVFR